MFNVYGQRRVPSTIPLFSRKPYVTLPNHQGKLVTQYVGGNTCSLSKPPPNCCGACGNS